jgi:hypothetical protein
MASNVDMLGVSCALGVTPNLISMTKTPIRTANRANVSHGSRNVASPIGVSCATISGLAEA